jgi:hypothetical protein
MIVKMLTHSHMTRSLGGVSTFTMALSHVVSQAKTCAKVTHILSLALM